MSQEKLTPDTVSNFLTELELTVYWSAFTQVLREKQEAIKTKLLITNPEDTLTIVKLQNEYKTIETVLNLPKTHRIESRG